MSSWPRRCREGCADGQTKASAKATSTEAQATPHLVGACPELESPAATVSVVSQWGAVPDDAKARPHDDDHQNNEDSPLETSRQHVVAYHEAGHAVVATALGIRVEWIERNGDGSGLCHMNRASRYKSVTDELAIGVAGGLASAYKFGTAHHSLSPEDLLGIRNLTRSQQIAAIDCASQILRSRWDEVEALADRLLNDPDGFVPIPFAPDYRNL